MAYRGFSCFKNGQKLPIRAYTDRQSASVRLNEMITMNNLHLTEKESDILVRQMLNIGEAMYESGAEISRIEDTLHRMGKAYGAAHVNVYAITSSIIVTVEYPDAPAVTQSRRVHREAMDLHKLEQLNSLCRSCSKAPLAVEELRERVLAILSDGPSDIRVLAGSVIAAGFFAMFFGGDLLDGLAGALCALLVWVMQKYLRPLCSGRVFVNLIISFAVGVLVCLGAKYIPALDRDKIMIGVIMVLIPGIAITNSLRYTISGDSISGVEKLIASILQAAGIAAGVALAIYLMG